MSFYPELPARRGILDPDPPAIERRPKRPWTAKLGDALRGVGELFGRDDIVDAQWRIVEPILDNVTPVYPYQAGTWGPEEAAALMGGDGPWRNPQPA